jgi:hypothetical protein
MHFQNTLHSPIVAETDQCIQPALHTGQPFTQDIIAYCADNMRPEKRNALPKHADHTLTYSFIVAKTALQFNCPSQDVMAYCSDNVHYENTLHSPSHNLSLLLKQLVYPSRPSQDVIAYFSDNAHSGNALLIKCAHPRAVNVVVQALAQAGAHFGSRLQVWGPVCYVDVCNAQSAGIGYVDKCNAQSAEMGYVDVCNAQSAEMGYVGEYNAQSAEMGYVDEYNAQSAEMGSVCYVDICKVGQNRIYTP